jgi:hypothetical protein
MARTLRFIPPTVDELDALGSPTDGYLPSGGAATLAAALAADDGAIIATGEIDATVLTKSLGLADWLEETSELAPAATIFARCACTGAVLKLTQRSVVGGGASDRVQFNTGYAQMLAGGADFEQPPAVDVVWNASGALLDATGYRTDSFALTKNGDGLTHPTAALLRDPAMRVEFVELITAEALAPVELRIDSAVLEVTVTDPVSIRERIEREFVRRVESVPGIASVQRWARTNRLTHMQALVLVGSDEPEEGGQGSVGLTEKTLDVTIAVNIAPDPDSPEPVTAIVNRALAQIAETILSDPTLTESVAPAQELALDVAEGRGTPPLVDAGQGESIAMLDFRVTYRHARNDPYTGDGITLLLE